MFTSNTGYILSLIVLISVMLTLSTSAQASDIQSPRKQLESGVAPDEIICKKNLVLAKRGNNQMVCVQQATAEKLNWEIIKTANVNPINSHTNKSKSEISSKAESLLHKSSTEKTTFVAYDSLEDALKSGTQIFNTSSQIEFVDDGREIKRSTMQKSPPPQPIYDLIMRDTEENGFLVGDSDYIGANTVPHEKYSINEKIGHYLEDWMPSYIPDGQRLVYAVTVYRPYDIDNGSIIDRYETRYHFAPTTFELHKDDTTYDLQINKGFDVRVKYNELKPDTTEDIINKIKTIHASQPGNYGEGFRDMTRDGKTVLAYQGGNTYNHYRAIISFQPDEYTAVGVISYYHTLDEIIPVFNSMMK